MKKIDIIPYSQDAVELLQNALAPIEIKKINVNEDEKVISIVVEDDDFASVIGKKGMNARLNSQLIGFELEVQRMGDYKKAMVVQRSELAASEDPSLDEPLHHIDGLNTLIFEHLIAEGFTTPRSLLIASPEKLASIPGLSGEMADKILEQIRKQRM